MDPGRHLEQPATPLLHIVVLVVHEPGAVLEDVVQRELEDITPDLPPDELHHGHVSSTPGPGRVGVDPILRPRDEVEMAQEVGVEQLEAQVIALRPVGDRLLQPRPAMVEQLLAQPPLGDLVEQREPQQYFFVMCRLPDQLGRHQEPGLGFEVRPATNEVIGDAGYRRVADAEGHDLVREVALNAFGERRIGVSDELLPELIDRLVERDHDLAPRLSSTGWTDFRSARWRRGLSCMVYSCSRCMSATAWRVNSPRKLEFILSIMISASTFGLGPKSGLTGQSRTT